MTTQTEVSKVIPAAKAAPKRKPNLRPISLTVIVLLAIIGIAVAAIPFKSAAVSESSRSLEAASARYQGLAEYYLNDLGSAFQRSRAAWTARYQGLAESYSPNTRSNQAWAAHYQGLADLHTAEVERALQAWSDRYQGLAYYFGE